MIALEFQRQLIKEQTNDLIIQQKLDKVKAYGHLKELKEHLKKQDFFI